MSLLGDVLGFSGAGRAGQAVSNANIAAEHGVLDATGDAQQGIQGAVQAANTYVPAAGEQSAATVGGAVKDANANLQGALDTINTGTQPYRAAGVQGTQGLQDYVASNPKFQFNLQDYFNSPAYQFQLEQGQKAIENSASAQGLSNSGAALKELTNYGQGLAANYYNQAFGQAQQAFQTNQNSTLQNLGALINTGEFGTGVTSAAEENLGGQQAKNILGGGIYTAGTETDLAKYLAGLNVGGAEASGELGLKGATTAGNFAVGAGQARAGGILGQGKNLTAGIGDLASILSPVVGSIPTGGGSATTLAGLFGGG